MPFQFEPLEIPAVLLISGHAIEDARGFFMEIYKRSEFAAGGVCAQFVQDNLSHSVRGVLRGLHYQLPPRAQAKLVSVVRGEVFDVAVDVRRGSPTYGRWVGRTLSAASGCMLYVPIGFAHGFCVLSEEADVLYKVSEEYAPELERGLRWNDPELGIPWPIDNPIVSERDTRWPRLADSDGILVIEGCTE